MPAAFERRHPQPSATPRLRLAIVIPCHNEAATIATVVGQFRAVAPAAPVFVCDNASTDDTAARARAAGATVIAEPRKGKGRAVRALIDAVDSDAYLMVDGDDTYPADDFARVVEPVLRGEVDMCVGSRLLPGPKSHFRGLNRAGNRLFNALVRWLWKMPITDMLSGYRAFSRQFATALGPWAQGFEIETDFTLGAARLDARIVEVGVRVRPRPRGSHSKLSVIRDGLRILRRIARCALRSRLQRTSPGRRTAAARAAAALAAFFTIAIITGCGSSADESDARRASAGIVGGSTTTCYPQTVTLDSSCTGVVIADNYVLTAGHCVALGGSNHAPTAVTTSGGVTRSVTQIYLDPDYDFCQPAGTNYANASGRDLAVVRVSSSLGVTPAVLATSNPAIGATVDGVGYGAPNYDWRLGHFAFNGAQGGGSIGLTGQDAGACGGDSGGPLFRHGDCAAGGAPHLIGVFSSQPLGTTADHNCYVGASIVAASVVNSQNASFIHAALNGSAAPYSSSILTQCCTPTTTRSCTQSGCSGTQTCGTDGRWGTCNVGTCGTGGSSGSSSSGNTSSSSSGGSCDPCTGPCSINTNCGYTAVCFGWCPSDYTCQSGSCVHTSLTVCDCDQPTIDCFDVCNQ